jgi:hypothetical protein
VIFAAVGQRRGRDQEGQEDEEERGHDRNLVGSTPCFFSSRCIVSRSTPA